LDDILEEIVGEISDESDFDEKLYIKQSDGSYIFEGKIILNNLCKNKTIWWHKQRNA
jgi:Mg2+/Co2+ transporter CorB